MTQNNDESSYIDGHLHLFFNLTFTCNINIIGWRHCTGKDGTYGIGIFKWDENNPNKAVLVAISAVTAPSIGIHMVYLV